MKRRMLFQVMLLLLVCSLNIYASNAGFKWESGGNTMLKSAQVLSFILGFISIIILGGTFMFGSREVFHKILPVFGGLAIIGSAGAILSTFGISQSTGLVFLIG